MATVILKTHNDNIFIVEGKEILIKGRAEINIIKNDILKLLKDHGSFARMLERGHIIIGNDKNAKDDLTQDALDKQNVDISSNESNNSVEIKKD